MRLTSALTAPVAGVVSVASILAMASAASAVPAQQLTTTELRPLVLTTAQAIAATGFDGTLTAGASSGFKCGRQPDNHARYCSRIWDSSSGRAHPSISTVASFATAAAARAQISAEAGRVEHVGTVVKHSASYLLYFVPNLPGVGIAAIAQQAMGTDYAYAWCSSASSEPTALATECAANLLAAQVAKARSH